MLLLNKSRLGLYNPMTSEKYKYTSSLRTICEMIGAVTGEREFSTADYIREVKEEQWDRKNWDVANDVKLWGIFND